MEGSEKEALTQAETVGDERIKAVFLLFSAPLSSARRSNQALCNRPSTVIVSQTRQFVISGASGVRQPEDYRRGKGTCWENLDELAGTQKCVPSATDPGSNSTGAAAFACPPCSERVSSGCSSFPTSNETR